MRGLRPNWTAGARSTLDPGRAWAAAGVSGRGITAVLEGGDVFERAGVAISDVERQRLPPAATARNPHLAGRSYRAMGVSVVMHPHNPHVPTSHMNVRFLSAGDVWWFGGGFDLTPYMVARIRCRRLASRRGSDLRPRFTRPSTNMRARTATSTSISGIVPRRAGSAASSMTISTSNTAVSVPAGSGVFELHAQRRQPLS